ncbi:MAG TPA: GNAT family acetyltransferase [Propionibacteriaceae bacterium]|nr:GNAT family acetyltransferase [Propionibacteriaceae bacterium]
MTIVELGPEAARTAVDLWAASDLTRPWNDPYADFARAVEGTSSAVLGLYDDETLVGTVMVGVDGHRGWVYYLASHPDRRREGIGRALVAAAERWVEERGMPKIQLMVRRTNASVVDFYTALGYAEQDTVVLGRRFDGSSGGAVGS